MHVSAYDDGHPPACGSTPTSAVNPSRTSHRGPPTTSPEHSRVADLNDEMSAVGQALMSRHRSADEGANEAERQIFTSHRHVFCFAFTEKKHFDEPGYCIAYSEFKLV